MDRSDRKSAGVIAVAEDRVTNVAPATNMSHPPMDGLDIDSSSFLSVICPPLSSPITYQPSSSSAAAAAT